MRWVSSVASAQSNCVRPESCDAERRLFSFLFFFFFFFGGGGVGEKGDCGLGDWSQPSGFGTRKGKTNVF